jgi:hypothetical protein
MRKRLLAALPLLLVSSAWAQPPTVRIGVEKFSWREYDADGSRLLEESGPRLVVGVDWARNLESDGTLLLQTHGAFYFGRVDYDGQACTLAGSCVPFTTDTYYGGGRGEVLIARRPRPDSGPEAFVGGGIDSWRRDIKGRASVSGAIEDWVVLYALAGAGYFVTDSTRRFSARAGIKYPFYVYEVPNSYDVTLNPEGAASFFMRVSVDFFNGDKPIWGLGLYYDSYRFDQSDQEHVGLVTIWQPESRQDTLGIYSAFYF